jgi:predicted house-cleaning noncanonical NTP pyrophosphatase (MazG superfamily)
MDFTPKLVRDGIPDKIRANGEVPVIRVLVGAELMRATRKKVLEEAQELAAACSRAEMLREAVDVLEAFDAFLAAHHISMAEARMLQERRRAERGGFDKGFFLERVDPAQA